MSNQTTFSAAALTGRGFLPAELPPIFSSETLGTAVASLKSKLGGALAPKRTRVVPTIFHLARQGTLRRRLAIPHPLYYVQLCDCIEGYSSELRIALARSSWSRSQLIPSNSVTGPGRAIERSLKERQIVEAHAEVRATSRYLLIADIAQFYHSIYTHTLGWSLAGKELAKEYKSAANSQKDDSKYQLVRIGDEIDQKVRQFQDGQSVGLPIGPDASLLLAEVLLSSVDQHIAQHLQTESIECVALRSVDDYQIGVRSLGDAEKILNILQQLLRADLELSLNPLKTRIITLPEPLEAHWVTQLKGIFREGGKSPERQKRRDLLRLFDIAVAARKQHPEEHIFSYLLGILRNVDIEAQNWKLLEHILLQMALTEAGALRQMLVDLLWYRSKNHTIDVQRWAQVWEQIILEHVPKEHNSEVVWALWGLFELNQRLSTPVVRALASTRDPITALLALYLAEENAFANPDDVGVLKAAYQQHISMTNFWNEYWPLVYEATVRGWLSAPTDLQNTKGYQLLKTHGVRFLDLNRRLDPTKLDASKQVSPSYG